jgi:hypothetical protein
MRWAEHIARIGEMENSYKIFVGNTEALKPFGRACHRSEYDVKIYNRKMGYGGAKQASTGAEWGPVAGPSEHGDESVDPVTGGKFIEQLRFSQKNSAP